MVAPVRTAASWLAGRLLLLLLILAALIVHDIYRDDAAALTARVRALLPGSNVVRQLEDAKHRLDAVAETRKRETTQRITAMDTFAQAELERRIAELEQEIGRRVTERRSREQIALSMIAGGGFEQDFENEIAIRSLGIERDALTRVRTQRDALRRGLADAEIRYRRASERIVRVGPGCGELSSKIERLEKAHPILSWIPTSSIGREAFTLRRQLDERLIECRPATDQYRAARRALERARARAMLKTDADATAAAIAASAEAALQPLSEFLAERKSALEKTQRQWDDIRSSARRMLWSAFLILAAITLLPVLIRAFLYYVVAPAAARRPPIRLMPKPGSARSGEEVAGKSLDAPLGGHSGRDGQPRISAVSQDLPLNVGEEMLVQPDFLQSSSDRAQTDTRWLLDWRYPITSIAAGMVALTRIRVSSPQSFVISSKTDPLSEVGVIELEAGSAFTMQPRNLVGIVQRIGSPVRIESRWQLARLSAWITLQFRYLVFHGPGTLVVQGCRGVRLEGASVSRSIDQAATIGFSANLDYNCRRTETFGAYLLGMRSLFNDNFRGAPGVYAYEEMPYLYKKTGITGRGLEGLVDGIMKALGI